MVSIKKYLQGTEAELSDSLLRMCRLILQAINLHAIKGDETD